MPKFFTHLLCCFLTVSSAMAFSQEALTDEQIQELMGEWKPLEVTGDAIPWDMFAKTTETEICKKDEEGYDYCLIEPGYSDEIKALDGKEVTLMGYMFPLENSEKQSNFLIGPYPLSCPFHYHIGPSQVVEVFTDEPIEFSYEPITLKGTMSVRYNEETGVFYYLEGAAK